jgi:hypothetical protein
MFFLRTQDSGMALHNGALVPLAVGSSITSYATADDAYQALQQSGYDGLVVDMMQ